MRILTVVLFGLIAFNLLVWIKPELFMNYLRLGKPTEERRMGMNKTVWDFIESPQYIWYLRIMAFIAVVTLLVFASDAF